MRNSHKYSHPEIERRWLVGKGSVVEPSTTRTRYIEDRYILNTHLRLRTVREHGAKTIFKLGKKYETDSPGVQHVVSTYLSQEDYEVLASLPALVARKQRHSVAGGSLDEYEVPRQGLRVFEIEFNDQAASLAYEPPAFVGEEITGNAQFTGFALASSAA